METQDRAKTRHTSVETERRPRHEKPRLETVSIQDTTCLDAPSLDIMNDDDSDYLYGESAQVFVERLDGADAARAGRHVDDTAGR